MRDRRIRVAFAGTPEFAASALRALLDAGFDVPLVLTQPDRPAGRGMRLQASAVKHVAQGASLTVIQPRSLRLDGKYPDDAQQAQAALEAAAPDVMVVAAYGLILPAWTLRLPRLGCLNIHASILPRWRGAAPIHRAIEAGDETTGVTIMQMDEGLDTGPMLLTDSVAIDPSMTTGQLHDRLADRGAKLIVDALHAVREGRLSARPQPQIGVTYAHKVDKSEAALDWGCAAQVLERRVRAFDPFPGATLRHGQTVVKVWRARAITLQDRPALPPGTILALPSARDAASGEETPVRVLCGQGALDLLVLQRPSATRQPAARVAQALDWAVGGRLG